MICPKCKKSGALSTKRESVGAANEIHFACECPACGAKSQWHQPLLSSPGEPPRYGSSTSCPPECNLHNSV